MFQQIKASILNLKRQKIGADAALSAVLGTLDISAQDAPDKIFQTLKQRKGDYAPDQYRALRDKLRELNLIRLNQPNLILYKSLFRVTNHN